METEGRVIGQQKTLLNTTLHLKDREVRKLRGLSTIKLFVFCPSKKNGVLFQLSNKGKTNPLRQGDALLSIEADEELFHAIMNPELNVTLLSKNERAEFSVAEMRPAPIFSSYDPLLEVMRYGYEMI
jgi:hypothetical protein